MYILYGHMFCTLSHGLDDGIIPEVAMELLSVIEDRMHLFDVMMSKIWLILACLHPQFEG